MKTILSIKKISITFALLFSGLLLMAQDAPFVTVLQPNGGENILLGSEYLISWNSNFTKPVKIDLYDYTNESSPTLVKQITASTEGSTFVWSINPLSSYTAGTKYKIRITSTVNNSFSDESNAVFSLVNSLPGAKITIENPTLPNLKWVKGNTYMISWYPYNVPGRVQVRLLDYSSGTAVDQALTPFINGSTFSWTIPASIAKGTKYKIKVMSEDNNEVYGLSENFFEITDIDPDAAIEVLQPSKQNITWTRGETYMISWIENIVGSVDINLYCEDCTTTIAADKASNYGNSWNHGDNKGTGFQPWDIQKYGTTGQAVIANPADGGIQGMATQAFAIYDNAATGSWNDYTYTIRDFGSSFTIGSTFSFEWGIDPTKTDGNRGFGIGLGSTHDLYNLKFNVDHAIGYNNQKVFINFHHDIIPEAVMFQNDGNKAMKFSFTYFDATTLKLTAIGPNGSETFTYDIPINSAPKYICFYTNHNGVQKEYWSYFDNFRISKPMPKTSIGTNVEGSTYLWTIPSDFPVSNNNKIEVIDHATQTVSDLSDYPFAIIDGYPNGNVNIEQPNASGIEWIRGSSYLISWISNVPGKSNIYLVKGSTETLLKANAEGSTWTWAIPISIAEGNDYKIKVTKGSTSGISANAFSIKAFPSGGELEVLQPNLSGITWLRGQSYLISWLPNFQSGPVNVELWKGASKNMDIATGYEGSTYVWTVPSGIALGTDYKIKVCANAGTVCDMSDNAFAIADSPGGTITIEQPKGGEIIYSGQGYLIAWIDNIPEAVNILLWDGSAYITLASNVVGTTWAWNVNEANGTQYKIRIKSIHSNLIYAESGAFTITIQPLPPTIFPNPAIDYFTVKLDDRAEGDYIIQLKDKYNIVQYEQKVNASAVKEYRISTNTLRNGLYFLSTISNNDAKTQKVLIQR